MLINKLPYILPNIIYEYIYEEQSDENYEEFITIINRKDLLKIYISKKYYKPNEIIKKNDIYVSKEKK